MIEKKDVVKMYNLPVEVKFCRKCTISNQRPRISFDEEGVCSACRFAEYKNTEIDWPQRDKELKALCDRFRRDDGRWDVIVPSSGGKDSSSVAHKLKYKYGMNPLTVTSSPLMYTDIGWENYQNAIKVGGLDNLLSNPNGKTQQRLAKLAFEIMGDPFQPFIYGVTNFPLQVAVRYKIPLVMYGENGEVEYGGNMKNAFVPTRDYSSDHVKHYFSGIGPEDFAKYGLDMKDLLHYMAPPLDELKANRTEIHFLSYYQKWVPQENYYYAVENTGFRANPTRSEGTYSKYASLDDRMDGFHYYLSFIKFGIGRAMSDSAHEIRDNHLTREEGVALVRRFDGEFPQKYFKDFLEYCDITEEFFWEVIDSWRSHHLWEKENGTWRLKHQIS